MLSVNELTSFFGWCTVINSAFYLFSGLFIFGFKNFTINLHSKIAGIDPAELPKMYFTFMGNFKVAILLFNLTPYLALTLIS